MVIYGKGQTAIVFWDDETFGSWIAFGKDRDGRTVVEYGVTAEQAFDRLPDISLSFLIEELSCAIDRLKKALLDLA